MRRGSLRTSSIAISLFLFFGACLLPVQKAHTLGQELRDIPISLGDMAFNMLPITGPSGIKPVPVTFSFVAHSASFGLQCNLD